jgi:serine phosphatase RsbU (regulator of sigma subunit)
MRYNFIFFLFFINCAFGYAQNREIDSLIFLLNKQKDKSRIVSVSNELSLAYSEIGEITPSYNYAIKALDLATKISFQTGIAKSYYSLARVNQYKGDLDAALEYHYKALPLFEKLKDTVSLAWTALNMGIVYCAQAQYIKAIEHDNKALQLFEKCNHKQGLAYSALNLSIVHNKLGKNKVAMELIERTLQYCLELKDVRGVGYAYTSIGNIHKSEGDYAKALYYYNECIKLREKYSDKSGIAVCYNFIADVELLKKQYVSAHQNYQSALKMASEVQAKDIMMISYLGLSKTDSIQNNFQSAYHNFQKYTLYRDSIFNEESGKKALLLQSHYESEKKDIEIKLLMQQQETERIVSADNNQKLLLILASVIMGLVTVGFFSMFYYKRFNQVKRQRNIISKQKERSDEQHKSIKDSIVYARRIQRALLTSDEYIKAHLNLEFFIFYQPKDIVSGDFYWAVEHNRKFYMIAADCTGHGVPGAFMSLLNISFLNELIVEKNISSPAKILNEQRKQIIKALNPNGTENSQDGMDCVLCEYDLDSLTLNFAAANNSLWIIRDNKILEFKGDKMPVGKHLERNEDFTEQTITLEHGDVIYSFTDGVADQFGGEEGKKFKYKQLSDLLLSIHHLPMEEQKEKIQQTINAWKGNKEQTDDMLIVGVKI